MKQEAHCLTRRALDKLLLFFAREPLHHTSKKHQTLTHGKTPIALSDHDVAALLDCFLFFYYSIQSLYLSIQKFKVLLVKLGQCLTQLDLSEIQEMTKSNLYPKWHTCLSADAGGTERLYVQSIQLYFAGIVVHKTIQQIFILHKGIGNQIYCLERLLFNSHLATCKATVQSP